MTDHEEFITLSPDHDDASDNYDHNPLTESLLSEINALNESVSFDVRPKPSQHAEAESTEETGALTFASSDVEDDQENGNDPQNNNHVQHEISRDHEHYALDPKRYLVLGVFCGCNLLGNVAWITFAPIQDAVQFYFNVSESQVNWLCTSGMATYGPATVVTSWSMRKFGFRVTVLWSALLMALGMIMRWISIYWLPASQAHNNNNNNDEMAYILLLTGQALVSIGQPVFSNAPVRVAAAWFQQTTMATGVAVFSGTLGMVVQQTLSPFMVQEQDGKGLGTLLFGQAVVTVLCFIATCLYFQSAPLHPPTPAEAALRRQSTPASTGDTTATSISAAVWKDCGALVTDGPYVILLIAFGIGYGIQNAILTLLQPWLAASGFPGDKTAGLLGSLCIAGGVVGTLIAAPILDVTKDYTAAIRWSYLVAYLVVVASIATLHPSCPEWLLATGFTAMGMTQSPLLTISFEAAAAHSYPIPEELSSAGLQLVGQYLGILMIDAMAPLLEQTDEEHPYQAPFNIAFLVCMGISAAAALCYRGKNKRGETFNGNHQFATEADTPLTTNLLDSVGYVAMDEEAHSA